MGGSMYPANSPTSPLGATLPGGGIMPYRPDYVRLQHSTGRSFRVLQDLTYRDPHGHPFVARAGLVTDLATIPHSLWSVIAPFGQQSLPAIVHDQECKDAKARLPQRCRRRRAERRVTDARFHQALLSRGVPRFRAAMMWAGVSIGRYWDHGGHIQRIWLFAQLMLGWAAILWGGFHTGEWTGWVALGAPVAAALPWGRSAPALLLAQYPGLILVAIGLVNFSASLLEWFPNVVLGARHYRPSREQREAEAEAQGIPGGGDELGPRRREGAGIRRPFRGVGLPPGLRILPR